MTKNESEVLKSLEEFKGELRQMTFPERISAATKTEPRELDVKGALGVLRRLLGGELNAKPKS